MMVRNNFIQSYVVIISLFLIHYACFAQSNSDESNISIQAYPYAIRYWHDTLKNQYSFFEYGTNRIWSQNKSKQNLLNLVIDCHLSSSFIMDSIEPIRNPMIIVNKKMPLDFKPEGLKPLNFNPLRFIFDFIIDTKNISNKWQDVESLDFNVKVYDESVSNDNPFKIFKINLPLKANQIYNEERSVIVERNIDRPKVIVELSSNINFKNFLGDFPKLKKIFAWWFVNYKNEFNNRSDTVMIDITHYKSLETYIHRIDTVKCTESFCLIGIVQAHDEMVPGSTVIVGYKDDSYYDGPRRVFTGRKVPIYQTIPSSTRHIKEGTCKLCSGTGKIVNIYRRPVNEWYAWNLKIENPLGAIISIYNPLHNQYEQIPGGHNVDCIFYFMNYKNFPIVVHNQSSDCYLLPIDDLGRPLKRLIIK